MTDQAPPPPRRRSRTRSSGRGQPTPPPQPPAPARPRRLPAAPPVSGRQTLAPRPIAPDQAASFYTQPPPRTEYQGLRPESYVAPSGAPAPARLIVRTYKGRAVFVDQGQPLTTETLERAEPAGQWTDYFPDAGPNKAWGPPLAEQELPVPPGQQFGLPPGDPTRTMRGKFAQFMGSPWGVATQIGLGALPGAAVGGAVAGPVGAGIGGLLTGGFTAGALAYNAHLQSAYGLAEAQRRFDESVFGQAGKWLDVPRQWLEQGIGTGAQLATDPEATLKDLGSAWQAARLTYESAPVDVRALDPGRWIGGTTPPLVNTSGLSTFVDYDLPETTGGIAALVEARKRIAAGEDPNNVFAEIQGRYGAPGQIRELLSGFLLDPLNFAEPIENVSLRYLAGVTGATDLARAAQLARVGPFSGGLVDVLQQYRNLKAMKLMRQGFTDARSLNWFQRALLGQDIVGVLDGTYKPPRAWEFWRLTPESMAAERVHQANNYIQAYLTGAVPLDENFPAEAARIIQSMKNARLDQAGGQLDPAARAMLSLEGQVVQRGLRHGGDVELDLLKAWQDSADDRTLLHDLAQRLGDTPENIVRRATTGEADALLRLYGQAGGTVPQGLTGKALAERLQVFAEGAPHTLEMYRAALMAGLLEQTGKWASDFFKVRAPGFVERLAATTKAAQSAVLLGLNPGYLVNNILSNEITSIARGAWGLHGLAAITDELNKYGLSPGRLAQGVGAADIGDMPDGARLWGKLAAEAGEAPIRTAREGPADALERVRQTANKIGSAMPFLRWSQKVERWYSARAYGEGFLQMMERVWRRGVGFDRMAPELEQALAGVDPRLPEYIYAAVEAGYTPADITRAVMERAPTLKAQALYNQVGQATGMDGDRLRSVMQIGGVERALNAALAKAETPADVRRAFQDVRVQAEEHIAELAAADAKVKMEHAAQAAGANDLGIADPGALLEQLDALRLRLNETFVAHKRLLEEVWGERLRHTISTAEFVKRYRESGDRLYRRGYFVEEQGVIDGLAAGLRKAEFPLDDGFELAKRSQHQLATDFFEFKEERLDEFFALPDAQRTDARWQALQKEIDDAYRNLIGHTEELQASMDDYLAAAYEARFPGSGAKVKAWRDLVRAHDAEYSGGVMRTFERARQLTDPVERHRLWREFDERTIKQRATWAAEEVAARKAIWEDVPGRRNLEASSQLSPAAPEGTPAAPPAAAPPETPAAIAQQLAVDSAARAMAEDPTLPQPVTRWRVREVLARALNLTDEQPDVMIGLLDARAQVWSRYTGRPMDEWYSAHIASIEQGGEGVADLFQAQEFVDLRTAERALRLEMEARRAGLADIDARVRALRAGAAPESAAEAAFVQALGRVQQLHPEGTYLYQDFAAAKARRLQVVGDRLFQELVSAGLDEATARAAVRDAVASPAYYTQLVLARAPRAQVWLDELLQTWADDGSWVSPSLRAYAGLYQATPGAVRKGAVSFLEDGRAVIRGLQSPDISTAVHEFGHVFRRDLQDLAETTGDLDLLADLDTAAAWSGAERSADGRWTWSVEAEEKFARGFEDYLRTNRIPDEAPQGLRIVFMQLREWLTRIYASLRGFLAGQPLTPEVRQVYDRLLFESPRVATEAGAKADAIAPELAAAEGLPDPAAALNADRAEQGLPEYASPADAPFDEALLAARRARFLELDRQLEQAGGDASPELIRAYAEAKTRYFELEDLRPPVARPVQPPTTGPQVTDNASRRRIEIEFDVPPAPERAALLLASGWKREKRTGLWYKRGDFQAEGRRLAGLEPLTAAEVRRLERVQPQLPQPPAQAPLTLAQAVTTPRGDLPPGLSAAVEQTARQMLAQLAQGEAGERVFVRDAAGYLTGDVLAQPSTYPDWYGVLAKKRSTVENALQKIIADAGRDVDRAGQRIIRQLKEQIFKLLSEGDPVDGTPPEPEILRWLGRSESEIAAAAAQWQAAGVEPLVPRFVDVPAGERVITLAQLADSERVIIDGESYTVMLTPEGPRLLDASGLAYALDEPALQRMEVFVEARPGAPEPPAASPLFQELPANERVITLPDGRKAAVVGRDENGRVILRDLETGALESVDPNGTLLLLPPGVLSDDGASPPPLAAMESEAYYRQLRPVLAELQQAAEADVARGRVRGHADLPAELQERVANYVRQVGGRMSEAKLLAMKWGEYKRDSALLNYSRRYMFDTYLGMVAPYEFWTTHSMIQWALHSLQRPYLLAHYYRIKRFLETNVTKPGFPSRLLGRVKIPLTWLPDWMGGGVWVDPLKIGLPIESWSAPWEQYQLTQSKIESRAERELETMRDSGAITAAEYQEALTTHAGPAWSQATQRVVEADQSLRFDALDFAQQLFSPSLPLKWAYEYLRGTPERIGPLPVTRDVRNLTAALGFGGPGGVNLESGLRRALGLPVFDQWADYRIDRELANMAGEGLITAEQARAAMIERAGPVFDEAARREARQGGADLGVQIFGRIFGGAGVYPEGERRQRELEVLWRAALEAQDDGDVDALNRFLERYPEFEARLALRDDPDERLQQFLIDQVWAAYTALPDLYRRQVQDQLGPEFRESFLDRETRSYSSLDPETLAGWARTLGRYIPGNVDGEPLDLDLAPELVAYEAQQYYDERAARFDMETIRALERAYFLIPEHARATGREMPASVEQYYVERDRLFPGIGDLLKVYYALPENTKWDEAEAAFPGIHAKLDQLDTLPKGSRARKDFYAANPDVKAYFKWSDTWDVEHPEAQLRKQFRERFPVVPQYQTWRDAFLRANPDAKGYLDETDVSARSAFLEDEAQLAQYWDWSRAWKESHPVTAAWLSEATPAGAGENRPAEPQYPQGPQIQASPEMQLVVSAYLFSDQPLPARVRRALQAEYQAQGAEGSFDQWLLGVMAHGGSLGEPGFQDLGGGGYRWPGSPGAPREQRGQASSGAGAQASPQPLAANNQAPNPYAAQLAAPASGIDQWRPMAADYGARYGVPPEFILALIGAESGGNPRAIGDAGHSVGLFQLYAPGGVGHGLTVEQRYDPVLQFERMMPRIQRAYQAGVARGLTGRQLAIYVGKEAERPAAGAEQRYGVWYDQLTGGGR